MSKQFLTSVMAATLLAACAGLQGGVGAGGVPVAQPGSGPRAIGPQDLLWLEEVRIPAGMRALDAKEQVALTGALMDLKREDFGAFSTALRRVTSMGSRAVPYLGHVADGMQPGERDKPDALQAGAPVRILLEEVLRSAHTEEIGGFLTSGYRSVRAAAALAVGERHQIEHAPLLVGMLDDPEPEVRRAAIVSLRMVSNRFFGYRPKDSKRKRRKAVRQWERFWKTP